MKRSIMMAALAAALVTTGCGSSENEDQPAAAQTVVTVVERVVDKPAEASKPAVSKPKPAAASKTAGSNLIKVPDVVGENHQYAQDTMQAAGLYLLDERDATGQDRMLVWDRNWVVVQQDPPAGTMVDENTTITLSSKKDGE